MWGTRLTAYVRILFLAFIAELGIAVHIDVTSDPPGGLSVTSFKTSGFTLATYILGPFREIAALKHFAALRRHRRCILRIYIFSRSATSLR